MNKHTIPQRLDEPFKLILWTIDELLALVVPFLFLMLVMDAPISGLLLGTGALVLLKKVKGEQGHFFLYNLVYWYLPPVIVFKKIPPSYIREYVG